jgi:hypothetical protein
MLHFTIASLKLERGIPMQSFLILVVAVRFCSALTHSPSKAIFLVGADLRKAVFDGFPASQAVGCDISPEFFDLGYKLWKDKGACDIVFIRDNVFEIPDPTINQTAPEEPSSLDGNALSQVTKLAQLVGRVKFLFTHSVFHLFNQQKQEEMARKIATLIRHTPGSVIFGAHIGAETMGFTSVPLTVSVRDT